MDNMKYDLNDNINLDDRKRCANLYLNNKYTKYQRTLIVCLIILVFSCIATVFGCITIYREHELYFLTFIEGLIFLFSLVISINSVLELSKIKKYIRRIYKNIDTLVEVESMIDTDNKVEEKILEIRNKQIELQKIAQEHNYKLEHPQCPTCGGHNTRRITTMNRAVSVGVVGLASSKIGKSFECLDCKYKW